MSAFSMFCRSMFRDVLVYLVAFAISVAILVGSVMFGSYLFGVYGVLLGPVLCVVVVLVLVGIEKWNEAKREDQANRRFG